MKTDQMSKSIPSNKYLHWPQRKPLSKFYEKIGNSKILRTIVKYIIPIHRFISNGIEITYVSWLVPAERVEKLIPTPLKLQKFYLEDKNEFYSLISVTSFKNENFGPKLLGKLRNYLCSSPKQVTCRLYVEPVDNTSGKTEAVFYLSVNMDSPIMTLAARLFSDGFPVHYVSSIKHACINKTKYCTSIDSGQGSGLDLNIELLTTSDHQLPNEFKSIFPGYDDAAEFLYQRYRAICVLTESTTKDGSTYTVLQSLIEVPPENQRKKNYIAATLNKSTFSATPWLMDIVSDCPSISFIIPNILINVIGEKSSTI